MARQEYKYLVPNSLLDKLRADMAPFVSLDPHTEEQGKKEYTVRSIYFDTKELDCYTEKIEGIKVRKKYRIRGYNEQNDENILFWEIKKKYNNFISKNRAPFLYKNLESFFTNKNLKRNIECNGNGRELSDAQRFFYNYYKKGLRPVILIIYDREAFFCKFNSNIRVTFDKNLRSSMFPSINNLFTNGEIEYALKGYFILEVKFNHGLPHWITQIIQKYDLKRMSLSKYTISLDTHKTHKKLSQIMFREFGYNREI